MTSPANGDQSIQETVVTRLADSIFTTGTDVVAMEEPLEIRVNGETLAVTMRTPGDDDALAAGFLVTESIIRSREDIWDIKRCGDPQNPEALNIVEVILRPGIPAAEDAEDAEKNLRILAGRQRYASSSCGICGRASIESIRAIAPRIESPPLLTSDVILSLPGRLRAAQTVFERTGGLHGAGLFTAKGELVFAAEDIGRHNTVDKVVGKAILSDPPGGSETSEFSLTDSVLMVSGRAGFEIVQKALVARIPAVCSVSAPSSLAVQLARESGMILVGFVRVDTMNIYSGAERVDR